MRYIQNEQNDKDIIKANRPIVDNAGLSSGFQFQFDNRLDFSNNSRISPPYLWMVLGIGLGFIGTFHLLNNPFTIITGVVLVVGILCIGLAVFGKQLIKPDPTQYLMYLTSSWNTSDMIKAREALETQLQEDKEYKGYFIVRHDKNAEFIISFLLPAIYIGKTHFKLNSQEIDIHIGNYLRGHDWPQGWCMRTCGLKHRKMERLLHETADECYYKRDNEYGGAHF